MTDIPPPNEALVTKTSKLFVLAATLAVIAAACSSANEDGAPSGATDTTATTSDPGSAPTSTLDTSGLPDGPSALDNMFAAEFPEPLVDPGAVLSGGPPPDGIPPVDDPQYTTVAAADEYLNDTEPILVVDVDGDVRAFPMQIMMWHEIVNDTIGGIPLAVTYCPLCNSAITFERTIRGVETTFGTSGSLYNANLVMYDRATESLWNQLDGRAVIGMLTGEVLTQYPSVTMSWSILKEAKPDALILDREKTGVSRRYGTNPYTGLDDPNGQPFLFNGEIDVRAKAMQRIVAIENENTATAWTSDFLSGENVKAVATQAEFDGEPLTILWQAGESSALDTSVIAAGRDVGTVGVFSSVVDGQTLTMNVSGASFVDEETSSTWNILGEAVAGPLAGTTLEPVTFVRTFWFSWAAFRPDTELIESS